MLKAQIDSSKQIFLDALVVLRNVTRTAEATGITSSNHYRWLKYDPDYKAAYDTIQADFGERVHEEIINRALNGIEETVTELMKNDDGEWVEVKKKTSKRFSDTVILKAAAALKPELYGDKIKQEITGKDGAPFIGPDLTKLSGEEIESLEALLRKATVTGEAAQGEQ